MKKKKEITLLDVWGAMDSDEKQSIIDYIFQGSKLNQLFKEAGMLPSSPPSKVTK